MLVSPSDAMCLGTTYICLECIEKYGRINREYQALIKVHDEFGSYRLESRPPSLLIPDKTYQSLIINELLESRP